MEKNLRVQIYTLLSEGHPMPKVASLIGCSYTYVRRIANFYVERHELEPLNKYRKTFQKPIETKHPSCTLPKINTMLPASMGGIFAIVEKPKGIQYNLGNLAYTNSLPRYKAQWGPHKMQIWLLGGLRGSEPLELLENAKEDILAIQAELEAKYHAKLTLLRWRAPEWIDTDANRSKKIAQSANIGEGERIEVAGALHKFSDFSHPGKFQINKLKEGSAKTPTNHAQIHFNIYSGEYEKRFEMLMTLHEKMMEEIVAIRQRMELENRK